MSETLITKVSRSLYLRIFESMKDRVQYQWGGKAKNLWADSHTIDELDCSGFQQFAMFRASFGGIHLPEGSVSEHEYCIHQEWKVCNYSDVIKSQDAERFFLCFLTPKDGIPGHVWLVSNGHTYECFGHHGVGSRIPTMTFPAHCDGAYEVPTTA